MMYELIFAELFVAALILVLFSTIERFLFNKLSAKVDSDFVTSKIGGWREPPELASEKLPRRLKINSNAWASLIFIALIIAVVCIYLPYYSQIGELIALQTHDRNWTRVPAILLFLVPMFILIRTRKEWAIIRNGLATPAVVTDYSSARGIATARYFFIDQNGQVQKGKSRLDSESAIQFGSVITILYLKSRPEFNVAYPAAMVELVKRNHQT